MKADRPIFSHVHLLLRPAGSNSFMPKIEGVCYHKSMNDLTYLASYPTRMEAEGIKGLLENNGVPCFLQFEETGDVMAGVGVDSGPTAVYVPKHHLEEAQKLIGKEPEEAEKK